MALNNKIRGLTVEIGGDTSHLGEALDKSKKKSQSLGSELREVEKLLKMDPKNIEIVAQKQKILTEQVSETKKRLELLKGEQEEVNRLFEKGEIGEEDYRAFQRQVEFAKQDLEKFEKQLDTTNVAFDTMQREANEISFSNAEGKVDRFKDKVKNMADKSLQSMDKLSEGFDKAGDSLEKVGSVLNVGSAAAAGTLVAGTKLASNFEDAIAKVSTIADEGEVPIDKLREQILELSNETGVEATEIANNVYDAISAGQSTADAVNFVSNSLSLSKAGFADAGSALDILTTILNAYGMEADEINEVSDMLIQTQNLGRVTVAELASSMGKVIPTANSYGVQLDQLAAAYSITTSKGVQAAESTTYINSMLNELGKSGTTVSDIIKDKTGQSFKEFMEDGNSLSDALAIIDEAAQNDGKSFNDMWSSSEAAKAGVLLLGDSADEFNTRLGEMNSSTGATETAMGKLETTSTKTKKIINELKNAGIELGDEVLEQAAPILQDLMGSVKDLTGWLKKLSPEQKKIITRVIEIVAVAGPAVTIVGKVSKGIGGAIKTFKNLTTAISPTALAITALVAVIGGLAVAIDGVNKQHLKDLGFTDQAERMQESLDKITEINSQVHSLTDDIKSTMSDTTSQIGVVDEYKNRMDELLDKSTLTDEEQQELVTIGDYFSEKSPDFKKAWNDYIVEDEKGKVELTGNADEIKGKLDELIDKYRQVAASSALTNLAQENTEASIEARGKVNEAAQELLKAEQEFKDFKTKWNITSDEQIEEYSNPTNWTYQHTIGSYDSDGNLIIEETATSKQLADQYKNLKSKMDAIKRSYSGVITEAAQLQVNSRDLAKMQAVVNGSYEDASAVLMAYNEGLITTTDIENSKWESLDNLKDKAKAVAEETGSNIMFGMSNGINSYKSEISKSGIETAKEYLDAVKSVEGLDEHSPSKKMYEIGENAAQGLIDGVTSKYNEVSIEGKSIANKAKSAASGVSLFSVGQNFVSGFINGIRDGSLLDTLWDAAKNIGSTALNAIKKILGIQSPSKEAYKIGDFFTKGYIKGIENGNPKALEMSRKLAEAARKGLAEYGDLLDINMPSELPQSRILTDYTVSHSYEQTREMRELSQKLDILNKNIEYIKTHNQHNIVLDDDTLVGRTVGKFDSALANLEFEKNRGL